MHSLLLQLTALALVAVVAVDASTTPIRRQSKAQVITTCSVPKTCALTFDDGPWIYSGEVVDILNAANATGTFFVNGDNYDCIYSKATMARIKYAYDNGHQIGSHTWSHPDLTTLTWDQIHDQMWKVELALSRIIGVVPAFMRPPYGSYNDLVLEASFIRGQAVVIWDFDSLDSDGATPEESQSYYVDLISEAPTTIIALNHETEETTVHQLLQFAITKLQEAGYTLVSVAECLGSVPAYQNITAPGTPDSTWKC